MKNYIIGTIALTLVMARGPEDPDVIVRGTKVEQFELVGLLPDSIEIVDGEVRLTGRPLGYFATRAEYRDYTLSFEWKYDRPDGLKSDDEFRGNSGVLLHLAKPGKVWPTCIQVQLAQFDPGSIFALGEAQVENVVAPEAQARAIRPVGEWNRMEVTCREGSVSCILNGTEVAQARGVRPERGPIAWQSEGVPVRFRSMKVHTLP